MNLTPKQTIKGTVAEAQSLKGVMKEVPSLDKTLTKEGFAADAKAVGDALNTKAPISHTEDKGNPHGVTASQVGARPDTWMPSASEIGARPDNWMPTASDVGARPDTWTPTAQDVGARPDDWLPTAQEVGARPNTWMPSASDVGAVTPTEVNNAVKKANPVNLLDNSDFRNAVNQREFSSRETSDAGMTNVLDRWLWWNVSSGNYDVSYTPGVGFTVNVKSGSTRLLQKLDPATFDGTTYTSCFCMCSDGTLIEGGVDNTTLGGGVYSALFDIPAGKTVIWAVAYKGHYTAETLPEYRPKGYGAELAECMRYYQRFGFHSANNYKAITLYCATTNTFYPLFSFHVPMRIEKPTFKINGTAPGETVTVRNPITGKSVTGTLGGWNNSYRDRLSTITIGENTGEIGYCYEAGIEVFAEL